MSELDAYRSLYIAESRENHENIVKNLLVLESESSPEAIAEIFRAAHSLKGMSASMDFKGMERLCHAMEDVFQEIRNGKMAVTHTLMDTLLSASDTIETMLDDIEAGGPGIPDELDDRVDDLKRWIGHEEGVVPGGVPGPAPEHAIDMGIQDVAAPAIDMAGSSRYCISLCLNESCDNRNLRAMILLQNLEELGRLEKVTPDRSIVEDGDFDGRFTVEMVSDAGIDAIKTVTSSSDVKEAAIQDLQSPSSSPAVIKKATSPPVEKDEGKKPGLKSEKVEKGREVKNIRVDITRLDVMMNLVEDLVINRGRITEIAREHQMKDLDETLNMIGRSVSDLQNLMMNIRMIPLTHIFNRFPRTVRDIANREGKEVDFIIEGGDTELDRSVMDGLNDPLMHLIRNAIDHGIERPDIRVSAGKPRKGTLLLSARRDRDNVIITIQDDGQGINAERVRKKAIERGLVSAEEAGGLSREEVTDFLFRPGFSTADAITDISGRGVGLDVVRTTLEALKGTIKVESTEGAGSKFELLLPPTMAIVTVMMVRINGRRCAIPVHNVVEVASLEEECIHMIGGHETILLRNEVLPLDRLDDMFGNSPRTDILVVLQHQNRKRSIAVDLIEGQQEVVIKPLSTVVGTCRGVSGVTIPGDGEVVPVLDVNAIIKET
ncbi:MAG: chemotaxis protein CheA [Methanolinea sp.]|jgi:two-component system chemotaxis sensor kinase CheA|nr:chemotaxis protein CheA [Methanolinea sp.]